MAVPLEESVERGEERRARQCRWQFREAHVGLREPSRNARFRARRVGERDEIEGLLSAHGSLARREMQVQQPLEREADRVADLPQSLFIEEHPPNRSTASIDSGLRCCSPRSISQMRVSERPAVEPGELCQRVRRLSPAVRENMRRGEMTPQDAEEIRHARQYLREWRGAEHAVFGEI